MSGQSGKRRVNAALSPGGGGAALGCAVRPGTTGRHSSAGLQLDALTRPEARWDGPARRSWSGLPVLLGHGRRWFPTPAPQALPSPLRGRVRAASRRSRPRARPPTDASGPMTTLAGPVLLGRSDPSPPRLPRASPAHVSPPSSRSGWCHRFPARPRIPVLANGPLSPTQPLSCQCPGNKRRSDPLSAWHGLVSPLRSPALAHRPGAGGGQRTQGVSGFRASSGQTLT